MHATLMNNYCTYSSNMSCDLLHKPVFKYIYFQPFPTHSTFSKEIPALLGKKGELQALSLSNYKCILHNPFHVKLCFLRFEIFQAISFFTIITFFHPKLPKLEKPSLLSSLPKIHDTFLVNKNLSEVMEQAKNT